ncbi:SAM-dependent methyltransferase [Streptomyces sp. NPDC004749]
MKSNASKRVADFERHVADPTARQRDHEQVVNEYYELVNETCQSFWGTTHHFSVYTGEESLAEAAENTERLLVDRGGFGPGMRLLDIGCGVGGPAFTVARHSGAHVTGLDMVPSRVETARTGAAERELTPMTSFEVGDALKLHYPQNHFDGAYSIEALCRVPDKRQAHREAARVLRPGAPWVGYDWILRDTVRG